jgi:hypothetical protein
MEKGTLKHACTVKCIVSNKKMKGTSNIGVEV